MTFARFVAIDWTGAVGERHAAIAVAECRAGGDAPRLLRPGHRWSRSEVGELLAGWSAAGERVLVGFDFCFGLPFADAGAFFPGDGDSPADMRALWAEVDSASVAADDADLAGHGAVALRRRHYWIGRDDGERHERARLRRVEYFWQARRDAAGRSLGAPSSAFVLLGAAQCGKASLSGMRLLHRWGGPVWPLDDVPPAGPLAVEIYCRSFVADAVAALPGSRERIGKITDRARLDRLLAALGSAPADPVAVPANFSDHVGDALISAAGMRARAADSATWTPPGLAAVRATEGWTFGIA